MLTEPFDFGDLDDLYREVILDHYRSPRNRQTLDTADIEARGFNPFCGDEVLLQLKLDDAGLVGEISQSGHGCSISQASASILIRPASWQEPGRGRKALRGLPRDDAGRGTQ